jgi:ABC-type amino acid transport system permease subunit
MSSSEQSTAPLAAVLPIFCTFFIYAAIIFYYQFNAQREEAINANQTIYWRYYRITVVAIAAACFATIFSAFSKYFRDPVARNIIAGYVNVGSDIPTMVSALISIGLPIYKRKWTTCDAFVTVIYFGVALLGLLSSIGSLDRVNNTILGSISPWWVGGIAWMVGVIVWVLMESRYQRDFQMAPVVVPQEAEA